MPDQDTNSIVILFKGGRLPSWYQLTDKQRDDFSQTHVDLMLSVADQYGMTRLEGFHLIGPQDVWQRFWLIEFPTMEGAEHWIQAEMAPPYGLYGYYEYHLSRKFQPDVFSTWVTDPAPPTVPLDADPHIIPDLHANRESIIVIMFARHRSEALAREAEEPGDAQYISPMKKVSEQCGVKRLEGFRLISPQQDWHRAWIIELPSLEAAEAFIEGEESPPHSIRARREFHLARKWSPEYFASWVRQQNEVTPKRDHRAG
ncbi:MAG: hypothetical protein HON53_01135 [Planctomycetaceae bacterium]|nr:hypothetical protein [Planctomycetaceae bacterium]